MLWIYGFGVDNLRALALLDDADSDVVVDAVSDIDGHFNAYLETDVGD